MAYRNDVIALSPVHYYPLDNSLIDSVGTANFNNNGYVFEATPISEDSAYNIKSASTSNTLEIPDTNDINDEASRIVYSVLFKNDSIQQPPVKILGSGGSSANLSIFMGFGNNLIFEADVGSKIVQIFSNFPLVENRTYCLTIKFSGLSYSNKLYAFIDGVPQEYTADDVPAANLPINRGNFRLSGRGTIAIGGTQITAVTSLVGRHSHLGIWAGAAAESLTTTQIREIIFEKSAKPYLTLAGSTEVNMQADLTTYVDNTTLGNYPLCLRIEATTEASGDVTLHSTDILFDDLASIHIQYMGTGTLTWVNRGTSNCSITSTPNGGTVIILNMRTITFTNIVPATEIRIYKKDTLIEIAGIEDVNTGSWSTDIPVGDYDIRVHSVSYKHIDYLNYHLGDNQSIRVVQFKDKNYKNP